MTTYCKTADAADYALSDTFQHIDNMRGMLDGLHTQWGTEYRRWEYGMTMLALREHGNIRSVLDVGGGSSLLAAALAWVGWDVTVVDPDDYGAMFQQQSARIGRPLPYIRRDFFDFDPAAQYDAVTCISVIEHVERDTEFFYKLLSHVKPGGLLCLTTDFHPERSAPVFPAHLRTYDAKVMLALIRQAKAAGFRVYGGKPDYKTFQPLIYGLYSFAGMVLQKGN